jgi:glutamyl-tRNA synthetase
VTGRTVGLPLFESVELLGRERTLTRIDAAAAKLTACGQDAQVPTP